MLPYRIQILVQIQTTAANAHKNLGATKQQIAVKERERRILQLTIEEITGLESDVNLYKGVGKMCAGPICVLPT